MHRNAFRAAVAISLALLAPAAMAAAPWLSGSPRADGAGFQYAVYFLPGAPADTLASVDQAAKKLPELHVVRVFPGKVPTRAVVRPTVIRDVQEEYRPPNLETLRYKGRGLSPEQAQRLQGSKEALLLDVVYPAGGAQASVRAASLLVADVARRTNGLIWDEETREVFSVEEFTRTRLDTWQAGLADVKSHITAHVYQHGEGLRAITLGMRKFGLPDIVANRVTGTTTERVGFLMNAFSQALVEGAVFGKPGEYELSLANLRHPVVRGRYQSLVQKNGKGTVRLTFGEAARDEGDPDNRLLELTFDGYPGREAMNRQVAVLDAMWGFSDDIVSIKHDQELEAASRKARAQLPALQRAFSAGRKPGELYLVKAPFKSPDGRSEWMWVEVRQWREGRISGVLQNRPRWIPALQAGQIVDVKEAEVFDWLHQHPDGRTEGNETEAIIMKMSK